MPEILFGQGGGHQGGETIGSAGKHGHVQSHDVRGILGIIAKSERPTRV